LNNERDNIILRTADNVNTNNTSNKGKKKTPSSSTTTKSTLKSLREKLGIVISNIQKEKDKVL